MLAVRLDPDTERRLEALAARTGQTKTFHAREAIVSHLDALEDDCLAEAHTKALQPGGATQLADRSDDAADRADMIASLRRLWVQGESSGTSIAGNFDSRDVARRGTERLVAIGGKD